MNQQVNLYQPMFRRQRRVLSGSALLKSIAVGFAGLMVLYVFAAWQVQQLQTEIDVLGAQRKAAQQRLVNLEQTLPRRSPSEALNAERARLEQEVIQRQGLLTVLQNRVSANDKGFSGFLQGLSRQRVDGLWLTGFRIDGGGERLQISGSALRPELVPVLVQRLSAEPTFSGSSFQSLSIDRSSGFPDRITFLLQTTTSEDR